MNMPSENNNIGMVRSALYIIESGDRIIQQLQESARGFETFFSLLSPTIWQSPLELAEAWIYMVAKEDYMILLEPVEDQEMDGIKTQIRKNILGFVSEKIRIFHENPSFLQRMKSRFLVLHTLSQSLPLHDQDRIIAKEMGIPYETWQQMMGFFSHNTEFIDLFQLPGTSLEEGRDITGKKGYILAIPEGDSEQIAPLGSIPGIQFENQSMLVIDIDREKEKAISYEIHVSLLFISEEVLRRYNKIIRLEEEESAVRNIAYNRLGDIPVWKKRFDGGGHNKPEPKRKYKLVPEGGF
ncbi:MAG: hypothetical protein PHN60_00505 [Candidatus Gracilibacteria bacterium]|nr:hypothetical protein [Candidatus Gracilibacteria bacterium]